MEEIRITTINVSEPGGFEAFLAGQAEAAGNPCAVTFGARLSEQAAGIIILRFIGTLAIIDYVGIDPSLKGKGITESLISKAVEAARIAGGRTILSIQISGDEEELFSAFEKCGFACHDKNDCFEFSMSTVLEGPLGKKVPISDRVMPFEQVTNAELQRFNQKLVGNTDRHYDLKKRASVFLKEMSFAIVEEDRMTGCILISDCEDGLVIRALFGSGSVQTMQLIQAAINTAREKYGPEARIHLTALTDSVEGLVRKLIPQEKLGCETMCSYSLEL